MARRRVWQDFLIDVALASGGTSITGLLQGDTPDDTKGMTLVRTLISLDVAPANDNVTLGYQGFDAGIGMAGLDAINTGAAALASPSLAGEIPVTGWLWRTRQMVGVTSGPLQVVRIREDIRAQRKAMYGNTYLRMDGFAVEGTAFTVSVFGLIRCLYLLE